MLKICYLQELKFKILCGFVKKMIVSCYRGSNSDSEVENKRSRTDSASEVYYQMRVVVKATQFVQQISEGTVA